MKTSLRAAVIGMRLRTYGHALKRWVLATMAALRRGTGALVSGVRARFFVFASLQEASARVATLQTEVAAARERLAVYHDEERLLARSIHDGELAVSELARAATECAEETTQRARATTDAILGSAQEVAAAALQEARAAVDQTLQAARLWLDATLEDARATARREVDAVEQDATTRLEPFMAAADRFAAGAEAMVGEMEGRIEGAAAELAAKIARFEAEREGYSHGLAALIKRHSETLERVTHLQADVHERLVPALNRLNAGLTGPDTSWLRSSAEERSRGGDKGAARPEGQARPVPPPPIGGRAQLPRVSGEVVVNHINSFHQVRKFVRALAEVGGVETVRLVKYVEGVATMSVSTEGPLTALDVKHFDELPVEVIEATPTRLVVRLDRRSRPSHPG